MNIFARVSVRVVLALAVVSLSSGCGRTSAPPTDPASTDAPRTALGRTVNRAIAEAREELATQNIRIDDGIRIGTAKARRRPSDPALPKAEISPQGDLLIEGSAVNITPAQRALLLQYRMHVVAIAEAGMALGVKGADLAGQAIGEAFRGVFSGNTKGFEQRVEAEAEQLEADARQLCGHLQPLHDTQQRLAASLPEFMPYATLKQADVDACMDHNRESRDATRAEIRNDIRSGIRSAIQAAVPAVNADPDPAQEADAAAEARKD